ncbi:AAA family ATPase [Methylovulum psychrotolerans]|uniref:AAA family ATPase n=1 Tax=Methylovulum psychrotolerans TaxID=1704499 RepID=UPI001BFF5F95|nr:AAA family ATPase [Methylovulum psychrotolerans]MBT9097165.1 AAA family ATPase [Methylovulum psychrotolerans]
MTNYYLQLRRIEFSNSEDKATLDFFSGVNVICGASDTGKSFLAESIDFMLGGSSLREIPERSKYGSIELDLAVNNEESYTFRRSTSGGGFNLTALNGSENQSPLQLKQSHGHGKTDNLSGFLLEKIGLLGKRILKNKSGGTQSLSFRNLAKLIIIQEGEIQQRGSPFWGGQYTQKTVELAAIKLLLTSVDDSSIVSANTPALDNSKQIALIDELLADIAIELADIGEEESELIDQLSRLESSIEKQREHLSFTQRELDRLLLNRRTLFDYRQELLGRLEEIKEHLARFDLLRKHYEVDISRLMAIQESGSMFANVEQALCPLCGAEPKTQHIVDLCDGDVVVIVQAASAEIIKISRLKIELADTVAELQREALELIEKLNIQNVKYNLIDSEIQEKLVPQASYERESFSEFLEKRASVKKAIDLYERTKSLEERKLALLQEEEKDSSEDNYQITTGIPIADAHYFSMKIARMLKDWDFPGDCNVHFDKDSSDFVIDGKPRGSRGKGLRAITHAAVTIGLLEYCKERGFPHPGFVILDSPLLAYFKPEGEDDLALQGTNLKECFYNYLIKHHANESQIIIIENQHPPSDIINKLEMTVFTGNPNEGRFGLL